MSKFEVSTSEYRTLRITAAADIAKGDILTQGQYIGFAFADIVDGALGELVWECALCTTTVKKAAEEWTAGIPLYYDAGAEEITLDDNSGANAQVANAFNDVAADVTEAIIIYHGKQ